MSILPMGLMAKGLSNVPMSDSCSRRCSSAISSRSLKEYCSKVEIHRKNLLETFLGLFKKGSTEIPSDINDIVRFIKKHPKKDRFIAESMLLEKALLETGTDMRKLHIKHLPDSKGIDALTGKPLPANKRLVIIENKPYTGVLKHEKHKYTECNCIEGPFIKHETDYTFGIYKDGKCVGIEKFVNCENI